MKRLTSPIINLLFTPSLPPFTHHIKSTPACRRFSAYSLQASGRLEEDSRNVRVSVWWDFANCNLPTGTDVFKVTTHITAAIRANGIKGPIQITAFGDVFQLTRSNQEALSSTGITLTHIPQGGKNSSDRSLLLDLMYWVSQNPPPCHILLISGDKDFASVLHRLRMNNYNVLLASLEPVPSVLCSAASIMWHWHALLRGENITGKHFNKPPDGPQFSCYGQFRVPLEDPFAAPQHPSSSLSPGVEVLQPRPGEDSNLCTIPLESSNAGLDSKIQSIPRDVVKRIHHVLSLSPKGIRIHALRSELEKSNINFDSHLYGYKTFSHLLLSMPHILKFVRSHGKCLVCAVKPPVSPNSVQPISNMPTNDGVSDLHLPSKPIFESNCGQSEPDFQSHEANLVVPVNPTFQKPAPDKDIAADVTTAAQPTSSALELTHPQCTPLEKENVSGSEVVFSQISPLPDKKHADVSNTPLESSVKGHDSGKLSPSDEIFADVTNSPLTPVKEKKYFSNVGLSPIFWTNSTVSKNKGSSEKVLNSSVNSPTLVKDVADVTSGAPYTPVEVKHDSGSKVGFFWKLWTHLAVSNESGSSEKGLNSFKKSLSIDKEVADVTNGAAPTPVEVKQDLGSKVTFFQNLWTNLTVFKESGSYEKGLNSSAKSSSPDIDDADVISASSISTVKGHDSDSKVIFPPKPWANIPNGSGSPQKPFTISANSPSLDKDIVNVTGFFPKFWAKWTASKDNDSSEKPEKAFNIHVESPSTVHTSKSGENWVETISPSTNPVHSAPCTSAVDVSILVDKISSSSKELDAKNAVLLNLILNWREFWSGAEAPETVSGHSNKHISNRDMYCMRKTELFCKDSFWNDMEAFLETPKAAGIISQSKNRDEVGKALKNEGPRLLKSVEERDLQVLVELLISEKKWLDECSSGPSNFKLARPHEQKISFGSQSSNASRHKPLQDYWRNDELIYPPNSFDDSRTKIKKHSSNRSRDAILSDCRILVADLMKETTTGFNMLHFKPLFRHTYGYGLDNQKLGYPTLSSLFKAIPGVRVCGNDILSDGKFRKIDKCNEVDSVWDELGPVVRNEGFWRKAKVEKEESDYDYPPDDDLFSDSDDSGSDLDKSRVQGKVSINGESSLIQVLESWDKHGSGSKNVQTAKTAVVQHRGRSMKSSKSIRFVQNDNREKIDSDDDL